MIARFALVAVVLAGCSELPTIQDGVCGNGVVEALEDCDHNDPLCVSCSWLCDTDADCTVDAGVATAGYLCGVDGVCHAPGGHYLDVPNAQHAFPVLGFRITDVDGDGIGDVVGLNQTALNTRYGDQSGKLPELHNVVTPLVTGSPVVTHLLDEEIVDLVMPTADGLVVYTGAFGVPSPRQFPLGGDKGPENMNNRPSPFDAVQVDDTIALFGPNVEAKPGVTQYVSVGLIRIDQVGPTYDAETTDVCDTPQVTDRDTWRNGLTTSYRSSSGATYVQFTNAASTCVVKISVAPQPIDRGIAGCPDDPNVPPMFQPKCKYKIEKVVTLPAFAQPPQYVERPELIDLGGLGCPSLVFADGPTDVAVYAGTPGGAAGCQIATTPRGERIHTGDLDSTVIGSLRLKPAVAGAAPDALITSFGIRAIAPLPAISTDAWVPAPASLYISDRRVRRAVTGDVDSDGGTDVVLTTNLPNLDIARRVPGPLDAFLLVRTATSGPITWTVIGDYDGDQRADLAYVEDLGNAQQRLSIAYGSPAGLTEGIAADAFKQVEFMAHMQVRDSTDPFELVEDLIVIDIVVPGQPEITILHGSPSRTMLSYFGLPVPILGTAFRAVAAGDFIDRTPLLPDPTVEPDLRTEGHTDLVAFQTFPPDLPACQPWGCKTALWVVPGLAGARFGDAQYGPSGPGQFILPNTDVVGSCANGATSDFCLETANLIAWPASTDHDIVLGIDYRGPNTRAHVLRFDPATLTVDVQNGTRTVIWGESPVTEGPFREGGRINDVIVFDVDGDGMEELIASFASRAGDNGHVEICTMTRDGRIVSCRDVATDMGLLAGDENLECVDAVLGSVLGVCDPAGRTKQLAVLCRRPLGDPIALATHEQSFVVPLYPHEPDRRLFGPTVYGSAVLITDGFLDELQIGDINGDAVDDIVALDGSTGTPVLDVFVQKTSREWLTCGPD